MLNVLGETSHCLFAIARQNTREDRGMFSADVAIVGVAERHRPPSVEFGSVA